MIHRLPCKVCRDVADGTVGDGLRRPMAEGRGTDTVFQTDVKNIPASAMLMGGAARPPARQVAPRPVAPELLRCGRRHGTVPTPARIDISRNAQNVDIRAVISFPTGDRRRLAKPEPFDPMGRTDAT